MLLCRRHPTLVHEGAITIERDALGELTFVRPDGRVIEATPRLAVVGARPLTTEGSARALRCWDGTRFNLGYVIDVLRVPPHPGIVSARMWFLSISDHFHPSY